MHIKPEALGPIHFIGIGGIGMSGIAEVLHDSGYTVQGSDQSENANVVRLNALGIKTFVGQKAQNVDGAAVAVVSSAIKDSNPEYQAAIKLGIPVVQRADMLAELMRLKPSVAVAGTHGKTTTTSLVAAVLDKAKLDPTVINGGIINSYGTNARLGKGQWLVAEADESDGSFTRLPHTIGIVTNIEPEHMDYYKTFEAIRVVFKQFIRNIPFYGLGILCADNKEALSLFETVQDRALVTYGMGSEAQIRAFNIRYKDGKSIFDLRIDATVSDVISHPGLTGDDQILTDIELPLVGEHNVSNATAALVAGLKLGASFKDLIAAFETFKGVKRRFSRTGEIKGMTVIDDYAHHPTEINKALQAARNSNDGKIIAVVQPHRFTRLQSLFEDFSACISQADEVIITPVYSAGEDPIPGFDHESLAAAITKLGHKKVSAVQSYEELSSYLNTQKSQDGIILMMGAGDITQWAHRLPETSPSHPKAETQQ